MNIVIKKYQKEFEIDAMNIWNEVVKDGVAFPQENELKPRQANDFFESQTYTGIAIDIDKNEIVGLYILHPNNVGRCAHICNASYAVKKNIRGQKIGEKLVTNCKEEAKNHNFKILQFNAVVKSNEPALHLYKKLGFTQLGVIPKGFKLDSGEYEDIIPHYITL